MAMNSTPRTKSPLILVTALPPAPPMPITLILAKLYILFLRFAIIYKILQHCLYFYIFIYPASSSRENTLSNSPGRNLRSLSASLVQNNYISCGNSRRRQKIGLLQSKSFGAESVGCGLPLEQADSRGRQEYNYSGETVFLANCWLEYVNNTWIYYALLRFKIS